MILSGTKFQCVAGETWDSVALVVYGNERYAAELLNANPQLCFIPMFNGGELLDMPVINVVPSSKTMRYIPETAPWKE